MKKKQCIYDFCSCFLQKIHNVNMTGIFFLLLISGWPSDGYSQSTRFTIAANNLKVEEFLSRIEKQSDYRFFYSGEIDVEKKVGQTFKNKSITEVLDALQKDVVFKYEMKGKQIILSPPEMFSNGVLQMKTVTGVVVDISGAPIAGVTVVIKGTSNGTFTDVSGVYTLKNVPVNALFVFSYVGMKSQEINTEDKTKVDATMLEEAVGISEIVVVGYGTQKRITLTGSVDAVSSKKAIEGRPVTGVVQALQGNSPGLVIQQRNWSPTGGTFNINIRGTGTTGNNDPLVVIDGIIGGDLNTLNPEDIDNVSVLKDAGSAAIYGSRSANGVILVTTKKGRPGAKPTIVYNGIYGTQVPLFTFHKVSAYDNALDKNISWINSGKGPKYSDAQLADIKTKGNGTWDLPTIMHNVPQTTQNLSISGGSPTNTYLMSFGYFNQRSYLEKSALDGTYGLERYNFRLNQSAIYGNFNTSWNLTYAKTMYNEPYNDVIGDVIRAPLTDSFQDSQGRYVTGYVTSNQLDMLRNGGYKFTNNDEFNGSFTFGYSITPALKVRTVLGGTIKGNNRKERQVFLQYYPSGTSNSDRRTLDFNSKQLATNSNLIAEYTKSFGKHDINILIGAANESYKEEKSQIRKSATDPLLGVPTTGTVVDPGVGDTYNWVNGTTETSLDSYFGRFSYAFANKYFIDGSMRADASSNFPKSKRWGYFPSIGGSWRLTEENFMADVKKTIGELKIRANYGILGNQSVNPYQFQSTFSTNTNVYAFNNSATAGATRNLANENLTWEKSATFDVGLDATLFNGQLTFGADFFNKITSDILAARQDVPTVFGSSFPTYNVSKVRDRGWEIKIVYSTTSTKFSQNLTFSLSDALSKLLQFSYGQTESVFQREEFEFVRRVGEPITVYQAYKTNGLYQTEAELTSYPKFPNNTVTLGDVKFVDKNGDGIIDTKDKFVLGNPFPRFVFGINYNATYRDFDATVFIQGVLKRDALIRGELIEPYHFNDYGGTIYDSSKDFWTPTNTGAKYPRLAENGTPSNYNNWRTGSDIYLFNAAYGRLKNVQIGYTLPAKISTKWKIEKARIYFTAQNIVTISPLKFTDPEGSEFGNNYDNTVGANSPRGYPVPVFYGMGLDLTF